MPNATLCHQLDYTLHGSELGSVSLTAAALTGAKQLRLGPLERWSHALAGSVVAASGLAILFLGR